MKYDKLHIALIKEVLKHKLENTNIKFEIRLDFGDSILLITYEMTPYKVTQAMSYHEIELYRGGLNDYIDIKLTKMMEEFKKVFPEMEIKWEG